MGLIRDTITICVECGEEIRCGSVIRWLCDDCEDARHGLEHPDFVEECFKCNLIASKESIRKISGAFRDPMKVWQ